MKTITVQSHFKKVSDKSSARYGEKRENLEWKFEGLESRDDIDSIDTAVLCAIVNDSLEKYGKQLLLVNTNDWNFDPSGSVDVQSLYNELTRETTRKRKVTKETLARCGEFYASYAHLIGKSDAAASAGNTVIANKLSPIAGKPDALKKLAENIVELIEAVSEASNTNIKAAEDLENNAECLEWIVNECEKLATDNADLADAL